MSLLQLQAIIYGVIKLNQQARDWLQPPRRRGMPRHLCRRGMEPIRIIAGSPHGVRAVLLPVAYFTNIANALFVLGISWGFTTSPLFQCHYCNVPAHETGEAGIAPPTQ